MCLRQAFSVLYNAAQLPCPSWSSTPTIETLKHMKPVHAPFLNSFCPCPKIIFVHAVALCITSAQILFSLIFHSLTLSEPYTQRTNLPQGACIGVTYLYVLSPLYFANP